MMGQTARPAALASVTLLSFWGGALVTRLQAAEYLVSDFQNNKIVAFDSETGALTRVVLDAGLDSPSALAIDPDGSLYVANVQLGNVLKVNPATGASTVFAQFIYGPGGLAWDDANERLFVSELGNRDGELIKLYSAAGALIDSIGAGTGSSGRTGVTLRDGVLYASVFADNTSGGLGSVLQFFPPDFDSPIGLYAFSPQLFGAGGLAFDPTGDLYVAGLGSQNVIKFNINGGAADNGQVFGLPVAYPSGLLYAPGGAAGTMLVTSLGNDNPDDPIYGNFLFPGAIYRYDIATENRAPFLVGDFDGSAAVGAGDLARWTLGYGPANQGDQDADGDSDGSDFLAWQRSIGNVGVQGPFEPTSIVLYNPPPPGAAVPEPASAVSCLTVLWATLHWRRRGRPCPTS
jgi:sugar lactone lactonase YvrE